MRKKLKYQGGITKFLCQKTAYLNKINFRRRILKKNLGIYNSKEINFNIISLSGSNSFEDQILSIYSFLYYAGTPLKWTIYSDKSYSNEEKAVFLRAFPFVQLLDWDTYDYFKVNDLVSSYLAVCPMAKKLNIILGHPYNHQTLYLDSDIIFYKNIDHYLNCSLLHKGLWYVPDTLGNIEQYFLAERDSIFPLNAGFLILNSTFDSRDVFTYLASLKGSYNWFSEQSSFEYSFRKQGGNMLDPRQFIVETTDQFDFSIKYFPASIAMRHYTSPVRHKMWQNGWKWHFIGLNM